jgi:hypothetical protein
MKYSLCLIINTFFCCTPSLAQLSNTKIKKQTLNFDEVKVYNIYLDYSHDSVSLIRDTHDLIITFNKAVNFFNSKFIGEVDFSTTSFQNNAIFVRTEFENDADFPYSEFKRDAVFSGTTFKKIANFVGTSVMSLSPADIFEYQFVDQEFGKKFIAEELIGHLTNIFAGLAIFICCIGLAGLASFTIEKRFREIVSARF